MALLIGAAVAAMVMMARYVQRGYQGYLYSTGSSHGQQFNPNQPFSESQNLNAFSVDQEVEVLTGQPAVDLFGGDSRLPSTPGGQLPGRILATKVKVTTDWDVSRDATYEAK
jgi:hypothetical protein